MACSSKGCSTHGILKLAICSIIWNGHPVPSSQCSYSTMYEPTSKWKNYGGGKLCSMFQFRGKRKAVAAKANFTFAKSSSGSFVWSSQQLRGGGGGGSRETTFLGNCAMLAKLFLSVVFNTHHSWTNNVNAKSKYLHVYSFFFRRYTILGIFLPGNPEWQSLWLSSRAFFSRKLCA